MRYRLETIHANVSDTRRSTVLTTTVGIAALAVVWLASQSVPRATAQEPGLLPALEPGELVEGPPVAHVGSAGYYSQELGTLLRVRYNTESYGQDQRGNLDIGSMQVFNFDGAITFIDGQITLNDVQGTGFNVGVGCRWLDVVPFPWEPERILGVSLWADGTSTEADNFFPQIGISYESLGDLWDFRANGYIPLGKQDQTGIFLPTGEIGFERNFLSELTQATVDHSLNVAELEVARRLGAERDAWLFAGGYALVNDTEETGGYRVGLRGYAYPDVLLQIAVSDDDLFRTNAAFSIVWFVGRTRTDYRPTCGLPDRFREPVMRNDYVALTKTIATGGIPLTDPDTGEAIRFVHVDSSAAAGGDGTYENPYDVLSSINGAGSEEGDIILAWAESQFSEDTAATLKNDQRLLGEGDDFEHTVVTAERGTIEIPETSPGAQALARPTINSQTNGGVVLADVNEVANLTFDGGVSAIRAAGTGTNGAGNPNLHDLILRNLTGTAISLPARHFVDTDDIDNDGNTTETIVHGNVTINNVELTNIGVNGIDITATALDVTLPNVQLQEVISISNVESTGGGGKGISIQNTHSGSGRTTTLTNYTYDGGTTSDGGILLTNFDGTFTASNSTLTNGAELTSEGVQILGDTDGTITFQNTVVFDSLDGTAFEINGDSVADNEFGGTVTVNRNIDNDRGLSVSLQGIGAGTVTFAGEINDTGDGIRVNSNGGGTILFSGNLTMNTDDSTAIWLTDNTGADINFGGVLDITTDEGNGFVATGGGTITASRTTNTISTATGRIVQMTGMTISSAGVNFNEIERTTTAATEAVLLDNNTGGAILLGDTLAENPGDSGTIVGDTTGTANAIVVRDSANVTISGLIVENAGGPNGVLVDKTKNTAMTVNINTLQINDGATGVKVSGGGTTGNLVMTMSDTDIFDSTAFGLSFDDVGAGTIQVNSVTIDGNNTAPAAGGVLIADTGSDASITFDSDTEIREWGGTDFQVDGGSGTISFAGTIDNAQAGDTSGNSVWIHAITGGSVSFTAASTITDNNQGVLVENNGTGTIRFQGTNTFNTTGDAVTLLNNDQGGTNAEITFTGLDITTNGGKGFTATGGGTLAVTGSANMIDTTGNIGLELTDMTVGSGGVSFKSIDVDGNNTATNGILLSDNTGGTITIGATGSSAPDGGTIQDTTGTGISITNTASVVLNGIRVTNAGDAAGEDSIALSQTNATSMSVTLNNVEVTTDRDGLLINGGGTGTFNVTTTGGFVRATENAVEVTGRLTSANIGSDINHDTLNNTGHSIYVHDVTAGNVTFTGDTVDKGQGVLIEDNTGGDINLLGTYKLTPLANNAAVTITNNDGASISLTGLDITTTGTGKGLTATNKGGLTVTGTTNKITSATGTGLEIDDMNIVSQANFESVTVNGAANGIVLNSVTGGRVAVGNASGASGSGGTINTTGQAILLTNVQDAALRHVSITGATDGVVIDHNTSTMSLIIDDLNVTGATGTGMDVTMTSTSSFGLQFLNSTVTNSNVTMNTTGSGSFGLLLENTSVNTGIGSDIAFQLTVSGSTATRNVTLSDVHFTADDASALFIDSSGGNVKTVNLLINNDSTFTNDSASAAADIRSRDGTRLNASIYDNTFTNGGAGRQFDMTNNGASARTRLDLEGNTANGGAGNFNINNTAGTFELYQRTDTLNNSRNPNGTVVTTPNDAAFGETLSPVPLPDFP